MSNEIEVRSKMNKKAGFTLIELMITVAIIGILAAIAYPSYQDQIIKTRRSDGQGLLLDVAARQERYYFDNAKYADKLSLLKYSADTITSPEGYYSVKLTSGGATFTATATPKSPQDKDTKCGTLGIDNLGNKTETGTLTPAECW